MKEGKETERRWRGGNDREKLAQEDLEGDGTVNYGRFLL
jgi:hypothetical protein